VRPEIRSFGRKKKEGYLSIGRRLAEQDLSNAGWQHLLATAHRQMGEVLQAQEKFAEAYATFRQYLSISEQLVDLEPTNANSQRELAIACVKLARLDVGAGKYADALPLYEEATSIFGALMEKAPGFAQWAKDKKKVEIELAACQSFISPGEQSS
jgi:tetratricopeptide (TPR) repeat protein